MITGELRSKVDRIWEHIWANGLSNPLAVIEQISYLLFMKRLDDLELAQEAKARATGQSPTPKFFKADQQSLRWSKFKDLESERMFKTVRDEVFPFLRELNPNSGSAYSRFMKDAVFLIPKPSVLEQVVTLLSEINMHDRDSKGDLYEYLLAKLSQAGVLGQFRTPRHIIRMMVEMVEPKPYDVIGDPAVGTGGFLVVAGDYLLEKHPEIMMKDELRKHFSDGMFHGGEFDPTMMRIGAMNLMMHGIEEPDLVPFDSLSEDTKDLREKYTLILANPPFKGALNEAEVAKDLHTTVKTKKTELLFIALFLKQLRLGGRCACIVPDGVLFGSGKAHRQVRELLIDGNKCSSLTLESRRRFYSSPAPIREEPRTSGSTICRRMAIAWTTSGTRSRRAISPTYWNSGASGMRARSPTGRLGRSLCLSMRFGPKATTFRSTATRRECMRKWSTKTPRRYWID